jgi:hypothetical protein
MSTHDTTALPVAVDVDERSAVAVRDHVEGVLGWQPVDEATARLVPPAVRLVAPATSVADDGVPCVLLVRDDVPAVDAARAAARHGTAATLAWPGERERLPEVVTGLLDRSRSGRIEREPVRVAGAAGGTGTSTVALALAGLAAWRGARVLVVLSRGAPVADVRTVAPAALAARDLWARATALPGVPGARAVAVPSLAPPDGVEAAGADLVVVDAGRTEEADVLVCRPDRAGLEACATTTAGAVVCNGPGAAEPRAVAAAAGGRTLVTLPWSVRVARAGLAGRVPTSLPGRWLRRLVPLAPRPPTDD